MKKLLIAILVAVLFNSCTEKNISVSNNYFDLSKYMNSEINRLSDSHVSVLKVARINGEKEENRFINIDWKREFDSFFSADIHGNSFTDKYIIDTIKNLSDSLSTIIIRYIAKDEELKTRVLEIHFNSKNEVELIKAELYSKNFIANLSESLIYQSGKYYSISNNEDSRWFGSDEFIIEGKISKSPDINKN